MNPKVETVQPAENYAVAIVSCGYERRSRFMIEAIAFEADRKIAFGYGLNEKIAFKQNKDALIEAGFEFVRIDDVGFDEALRRSLMVDGVTIERCRVLVDISCFTRFRLASLIRCFTALRHVEVDFFYSLAEFSPPSLAEPANDHLGPASEYFSGWSGEYTNPTVVISGLGYEYMKALGVIELVDPSSSWIFFPESPIERYDEAVGKANDLLLRDVDASHVLRYDVLDAPALVRDLFSLLSHLRKSYRCVLLPLGPKIFAFCAMLAGSYFRDISVWRVSAGKYARPVDRRASENYTLFRVTFSSEEEEVDG
ncbi:hypothetical protein ISN76_02480 [Dyella halodurans]|uniref:Uncharacterized protein n=1 Tax=Dyella halodurans TaxID=1920171 RepID=A0ABV9BWH4_9GAMM|nr:hypothetical protein [Dyella halodurans]